MSDTKSIARTRPAGRGRRDSQRGQSLVELSLVMVGALLLLSGAADLGRMYFIHLTLRDAAQEGAAYGSTDAANDSEIEARVLDAVGDTLDASSLTVTSGPTIPPYNCAGIDPATLEANAVRVSVSYDMPIAVPFLGAIVGSDHLPLTATTENTILSPPC